MAAFLVLAVCVVNNKEEELFATDVSVHTVNKTLKQVYVLKFFFSLSLTHFKDIGHTVLTSKSMLLLKQNVNNYLNIFEIIILFKVN